MRGSVPSSARIAVQGRSVTVWSGAPSALDGRYHGQGLPSRASAFRVVNSVGGRLLAALVRIFEVICEVSIQFGSENGVFGPPCVMQYSNVAAAVG